MNNFYTSVNRYGNTILYRGYTENGTRIEDRIKFGPTQYLPSKEPTKFRSFDGGYLNAIKFQKMSESKDFLETYKEMEGVKVYGTRNYIQQFITDKFPTDIKFNQNHINKLDKNVTYPIELSLNHLPKESVDIKKESNFAYLDEGKLTFGLFDGETKDYGLKTDGLFLSYSKNIKNSNASVFIGSTKEDDGFLETSISGAFAEQSFANTNYIGSRSYGSTIATTPQLMPKLSANVTCFALLEAVDQLVFPPFRLVAAWHSFLGVHSFGSSAHSAAKLADALISRAITVRHI